jgi:hypothetical protein
MVDALRRAHRMLQPRGWLVDLHPNASRPKIEVGDRVVGHIESDDGPQRHAAADESLRTIVREGLFTVDRRSQFTFFTYGDSIEDLNEYVAENWTNARIDDGTLTRAREALRGARGVKPRIRERLLVTKLEPRETSSRLRS